MFWKFSGNTSPLEAKTIVPAILIRSKRAPQPVQSAHHPELSIRKI